MQPEDETITIRQADHNDIPAITQFVDKAFLIHRNLDWRPLIEWVEQPPFLIHKTEGKITAMLSCAPDPQGIAWIHAFIVDQWSENVKNIWGSLLNKALAVLKETQSIVFSISLSDWYSRLLRTSGFSLFQKIVVLHWGKTLPPGIELPPEVFIRPMEPADLNQVAEVDRKAFEPAWVISLPSLQRAYLNCEHASVAEVEGQVVAYELSSANHLSAHLTRLAVLPAYTKRKIGYSLTTQMIDHFTRRGIWQITVNTQDNNYPSLSLYRKLGFHQTSESFPVFTLNDRK